MSAKYSRNNVLIGTMWNIIGLSSISRLTNLIDTVLLILNLKLADLVMFLLSWTLISSCCNALTWPISFIDWIEVFELIGNFLNPISLYHELINKLKISEMGTLIEKTVFSLNIIWCLKVLSASVFTIVIGFELFS